MVELKDANAVYEVIKSETPIYYRDPEYPANFRKVEPELAIRSINPFTHPETQFYRMVNEKEAQKIIFDECENIDSSDNICASKRDFFKAGWEGAKTYFNWRIGQE